MSNRNSLKNICVILLLCCSALINILLARTVISLKKIANSNLQRQVIRPAIGEFLPPIKASSRNSKIVESITSENDNTSTVLYIFSPDCGWCLKNADYINSLHLQARDRFRFIGISLSSNNLDDYLTKLKIIFPVYVNPSEDSVSLYNLGGTPQTIVISNKGEVLKNWHGAYSSKMRNEIESFMKVNFPTANSSVN